MYEFQQKRILIEKDRLKLEQNKDERETKVAEINLVKLNAEAQKSKSEALVAKYYAKKQLMELGILTEQEIEAEISKL